MWNKRGLINLGKMGFVLLVLALILFVIFTQREYLAAISIDDLSNMLTGSVSSVPQPSNEVSFYAEPEDIEDFICEEFEENVLWSSGFKHDSKGSTNYQTWIPKNTCDETSRENCFLQDISINSRTIYTNSDNEDLDRESYVQISALDESECTSPENGIYSTYLAYESVKGNEGVREGWYCGYDKKEAEELIKSEPKCGLKLADELANSAKCYGIKIYASQAMIIDVLKIKYKLCGSENG